MEDHSISGYLKRRSTEELEAILEFCFRKPHCENDMSIILEIQNILKERGVSDITAKLS